jgi:hypothetical protein
VEVSIRIASTVREARIVRRAAPTRRRKHRWADGARGVDCTSVGNWNANNSKLEADKASATEVVSDVVKLTAGWSSGGC